MWFVTLLKVTELQKKPDSVAWLIREHLKVIKKQGVKSIKAGSKKNKGLKQKNGFVKSKYKPACEDKKKKH